MLRDDISHILNDDFTENLMSKVVNIALFTLILINVIAIIIESNQTIEAQYHQQFLYLEWFSVAVFTIEYLCRLWVCVDFNEYKDLSSSTKARLKFIRTPMAVIDLLAILPFFLSMFIPLDLRFLRVLRLLRIFKLTRYSSAMKTLYTVFADELPTLVAAYSIMAIVIILTSAGIYLLEHHVQPEHFGDIPSAMWWSIITLTTVGYGDVTPITTLGKIFGAIISLAGISMVAIPTGILASGFGNAFRRKRQRYELLAAHAWSDGKLSQHEQQELIKAQELLGLSTNDVEQILHSAQHSTQSPMTNIHHHCPHCGKPID